MRWTRIEIYNHIAQGWGQTYNSETVENQTAIRLAVDYILEDISVVGKIPILKKHGVINAVAEYSTGTVTIATANGVSTVTGLLTVWTKDIIGRKIIVSGESIAYTIKSVSSATSLTLEEIYINTSDDTNALTTASAYTINKDTYKLARDFAAFADEEIYDLRSGIDLTVKDSIDFDKEVPSRVSTGNPIDVVLRGLSEDTYYSTGTVAVSNGSATIIGTGTAWTEQMNGMPIRIDGDSAEYKFTYVSALSGVLDRVYEGSTAATATYKIEFPGLMLCQFDPKPDKPRLIKYFYYRMLEKLRTDNDICPVPFQNALISGGIWRYSLIKEKTNTLDSSIYYQLYQKDLGKLRKIGKWQTSDEGLKPRIY